MKITFGRKFLGAVIGSVLLLAIFILALIFQAEAINAGVMTAFGGFFMFLWVGYIGGSMFSTWAKSKYFQSELVGK